MFYRVFTRYCRIVKQRLKVIKFEKKKIKLSCFRLKHVESSKLNTIHYSHKSVSRARRNNRGVNQSRSLGIQQHSRLHTSKGRKNNRKTILLCRATGPDRRGGVRHEPQNPRAAERKHDHGRRAIAPVGGSHCGGDGGGRTPKRACQVPVGLRQQRVHRPARGRAHVRPKSTAPVHTHRAAAPALPVRRRHRPGHPHHGRRREAAQRVGRVHCRRSPRPPVGSTLGAQATQGHTVHVDQREYQYM